MVEVQASVDIAAPVDVVVGVLLDPAPSMVSNLLRKMARTTLPIRRRRQVRNPTGMMTDTLITGLRGIICTSRILT